MVESEREARIRTRIAVQPHRVPLSTLVADQRGTFVQRLRAFAATCFVIERAHAAGVVHRDLRPATILIGESWDADVIGWGSAFVPGEPSPLSAVRTAYAAPELTDGSGDPRIDIYALGKILGELLATEPVSPELDLWCRVATSSEPALRVITAGQLGDSILSFLEGARDWELRRTIAATHLANATEAHEAGHADVARIEAGEALRLDPGSRPAADALVGSGRVPKEIAQLIEIEQNYGLRDSARIAIWAYAGYLLFAPAFLWFAADEPGYAALLLLLVALNIGLLAVHGYTQKRLHEIWFVLANAALIALVARVASPFFLAPGIAALTATALGMSPSYLRPPIVITMILCLTAAVLVPWIAELAGWISTTTTVVAGGLQLQAPAFRLREGAQLFVLVFYVVTLVACAGWLAFSLMWRERRLRYRTYVQLWQMRENLTRANR
jgi:hypothetical protein